MQVIAIKLHCTAWNLSETDTALTQHKKNPPISWSRLQPRNTCIARQGFSLQTLQPGNFWQRARIVIHRSHGWPKRTTIVLCAVWQTDRCLFIISASHITRRNYDGSHRRTCRCISLASHYITFTLQTQLTASVGKGKLCHWQFVHPVKSSNYEKGTVIAIIFTKFK